MISIQDVCFEYDMEGGQGGTLEHINLHISKGEVVVFCGQSGCGKTTMTRLINGLIPHFYDGALTGKVLVNGLDVSRSPLSKTSEYVGSIFQNPKSQFFNIDTTGELAFGCESHGLSLDVIRQRVDQSVRDLQLEALIDRNIFELSGGEKQQIACGSAYATDPLVYVMDEPSSNLDRKAILRLQKLMKQLKDQGKTLVISEHRLYYLMELADRFVYIHDGKIQAIYSRAQMAQLPEAKLKQMGLRTTDLTRLKEQKCLPKGNGNGTAVIEALDLNCSRGNTRIIDIDRMQLPSDSVIALIGDNGSGKSTLCQALCGVISHQGSVAFDGHFLSGRQRSSRSFMVMQDVNRQLFSESVSEELQLNTDISKDRIDQILDGLGLLSFKERHPSALSGGQKQRVAIASSLASRKQIIFFDEPTSGLDRTGMTNFGQILKKMKEEIRTAVIVTHDPELVVSCCTHVLHMENGRIVSLYPLDTSGTQRVMAYFLSGADDNTSRKRSSTSAIGKIMEYVGLYRKTVYLAAFFMLIGTIASVLPYLFVYQWIVQILQFGTVTIGGSLFMLAGTLLCQIVYACSYTHGLSLSHRAAFRTLENIRKYLQERMEEKPLGLLQDMGAGTVKKLFTEDIESIELLLAHVIPEGFANLLVPLVVLVGMTVIDWQLMILTLLVVAIGLSVSRQMYSIGIDKMGNYYASAKRLNNTIVEYVNGMEVVRIFNNRKVSKTYQEQVFHYRDFAHQWYQICWPWMALYGSLFSYIVLYSLPFGILLMLLGLLEVVDYILILCLSFSISPLLMHCMEFIGAIPQTNYKLQALEKAVDFPPLKTNNQPFSGDHTEVVFDNVHFAYKDQEVLKGISFRAPGHQMTAIVGPSGSGKTTIARLLAHYYDINEGSISIGGQNITDLSLESLNRQIAYVSQDLFLYNMSILENIRIGDPKATDQQCIQAAEKAQCDFIEKLPDGYQTMAGQKGHRLSAGQRQRIAFARAILKDAPVVVLDEATAYVDPENEQKMSLAIRNILRNKTVLIIAHKMKTIQQADQIVVLEQGKICAVGTHPTLIQNDPIYQRLWDTSAGTQSWLLKKEGGSQP